ncbi:MAG: deoxyguanosinetriphosphate triphosphohydrolase [Candidatus Melainabacteria bacterium GWA2_34_9]|nr:MAG: deoxyguanosinetriphosphate triphosphohydrolase [Candidatus Melainabacteria bacterium GWA2_34_9]
MNNEFSEIRDRQIQFEETYLSEYAAKSSKAKGRKTYIEPCPIRTEFQRDRDRILHSKAFRRLKHKTQVFISPAGDHYRTRMTHTLEVSQIARTIARALRLNEDLTEAIALGHDLGHTPFGHTGEEVLSELLPNGFKHNEQSLRIVETLEDLNLTEETLDGILNHTGEKAPFTLEGQIVKIADRIAYLNHDIDDAVRAGIMKEADLPENAIIMLGANINARITTTIKDIVENSTDSIKMSKKCKNAMDELRTWMFENVYKDSLAKEEEYKAKKVISELFNYYMINSNQLEMNSKTKSDTKERIVADYIAGMTDRFALQDYIDKFIPKSWGGSSQLL